jgi:hypothetical protein
MYMAEVLAEYAEPVMADGVAYVAQACGAPNGDGIWEGWIEFLPVGGGKPLRSPRETTQPNRVDAEYWATGLSGVYLEGALARALHPLVRRTAVTRKPAFDEPLPSTTVPDAEAPRDAVLDPYSVYEHGEVVLRQKLGALAAWHLVNIIVAYRLSDDSTAALNKMSAPALIEIIVSQVREHAVIR